MPDQRDNRLGKAEVSVENVISNVGKDFAGVVPLPKLLARKAAGS
jgi:hypothetical protein